MGEFQAKKAHEDLASALGSIGLRVGPELQLPGHHPAAMGPGETAPSSLGDILATAPDYLPPAPAEAVPSEPLDPPSAKN
ncbi:hypothetical protein BH23ACT12_BH23ACT12_06690 [soil metagenome]